MKSNETSLSGYFAALEVLLQSFPETSLEAPPEFDLRANELAEQALNKTERSIGDSKNSDYYRCSRERFCHALMLALKYIPEGGRILDVGNAPGYLAIALHYLGYEIQGINLNREWDVTYPDPNWLSEFNIQAVDIEKPPLPFGDAEFDGIMFTEVLEHIAVTPPANIIVEFRRVLRDDGALIFSTPNVCNISNIVALLTGKNIFWKPEIFYGSIDRHNREYTPEESLALFKSSGFKEIAYYGINDHANWRYGTSEIIYEFLSHQRVPHSLLRNTIIGAFNRKE